MRALQTCFLLLLTSWGILANLANFDLNKTPIKNQVSQFSQMMDDISLEERKETRNGIFQNHPELFISKSGDRERVRVGSFERSQSFPENHNRPQTSDPNRLKKALDASKSFNLPERPVFDLNVFPGDPIRPPR